MAARTETSLQWLRGGLISLEEIVQLNICQFEHFIHFKDINSKTTS